jgi:hypothetical protein
MANNHSDSARVSANAMSQVFRRDPPIAITVHPPGESNFATQAQGFGVHGLADSSLLFPVI